MQKNLRDGIFSNDFKYGITYFILQNEYLSLIPLVLSVGLYGLIAKMLLYTGFHLGRKLFMIHSFYDLGRQLLIIHYDHSPHSTTHPHQPGQQS